MSDVICFSLRTPRLRVNSIILRQRENLPKGSVVRKFRITAVDDKVCEITTWSELKAGHAETRRTRRIKSHTATCKDDLQVQIAELFQTIASNISLPLKAIYAERELGKAATIKSCLIVRSARALSSGRGEAPLPMGNEGFGAGWHFRVLVLGEGRANALDRGRGLRRNAQCRLAGLGRFEVTIGLLENHVMNDTPVTNDWKP